MNKLNQPQQLEQLKAKDTAPIREEILKEQDGKCAICECEINDNTGYSLDHQHMTSKEKIGEDGAGLVRGVLCRSCNVLEGRIWNNTRRYKLVQNVQERIDFLEKLIQYYKKDNYNYIHPAEKPKEQILSKRSYNKLKKEYTGKRKFPEYPKSKKLTKVLANLFGEYDIEPYN